MRLHSALRFFLLVTTIALPALLRAHLQSGRLGIFFIVRMENSPTPSCSWNPGVRIEVRDQNRFTLDLKLVKDMPIREINELHIFRLRTAGVNSSFQNRGCRDYQCLFSCRRDSRSRLPGLRPFYDIRNLYCSG